MEDCSTGVLICVSTQTKLWKLLLWPAGLYAKFDFPVACENLSVLATTCRLWNWLIHVMSWHNSDCVYNWDWYVRFESLKIIMIIKNNWPYAKIIVAPNYISLTRRMNLSPARVWEKCMAIEAYHGTPLNLIKHKNKSHHWKEQISWIRKWRILKVVNQSIVNGHRFCNYVWRLASTIWNHIKIWLYECLCLSHFAPCI